MYIPIERKITYTKDLLIERPLAFDGTISVAVDATVEPFTELGRAKISYTILDLGTAFCPIRHNPKDPTDNRYLKDDCIGRVGLRKIPAPFNGYLVKVGKSYKFKKDAEDYIILAGVWGTVESVVENKSVLLKYQSQNIHLAATNNMVAEGELVVFPNPGKVVQRQYLEKFAKEVFGKIIYAGDFIDLEFVKQSIDMGVSGILAGSATREAMLYGYDKAFIGVVTGFGQLRTPACVFNALNEVSNRYVFVYGDIQTLRIPLPKVPAGGSLKFKKSTSPIGNNFMKIKKGLHVLVLSNPYFGQECVVEKILDSGILVKLLSGEVIEVSVPNVLALN